VWVGLGYPEGHPNAIKKVEDEAALSEAEKVGCYMSLDV